MSQPTVVNTGGGNYFAGPVEAETIIGTLNGNLILYPQDADEQRDRSDKLVLLQRVGEAWISGVNSPLAKTRAVNRQFIGQDRILLPRRFRPKLGTPTVTSPLGDISAETQPTNIPGNTLMWTLFQESSGSLLILSEPGGGKTISLLEIAEVALLEFKQSKKTAIRAPVILPLASWRSSFESLSDWVIDEIKHQFKIPSDVSRRWLANKDLILLFDGLDGVEEASRADCVEQLNQFIDQYGTASIALTCRTDVYDRLETPVNVQKAVEMLPLNRDIVDSYFAAAASKLHGLHAALQQDDKLYSLLNSPLMLQLFSLAYRDVKEVVLPTASREEQRRALLGQFVNRMLAQEMQWPESHMQRWLGWIGARLRDNAQSIFYIEEIQPSWLTSEAQKRNYIFLSRFISVMLASVIGGFLIGLGLYFFQAASAEMLGLPNDGLIRGFVEGPLGGLASAPIIAFIDWLWHTRLKHAPPIAARSVYLQSSIKIVLLIAGCVLSTAITFAALLGGTQFIGLGAQSWLIEGMLVGINFGIGSGLVFGVGERAFENDIKTSESLHWEWRPGLRWGALLAGFGIVVGALVSQISTGTVLHQLITARFASPTLPLAIVAALVFGLIGIVFAGLKGTVVPDQRLTPNFGLRQSLFNALLLAPAIGCAFGLIGLGLSLFLIGWRPPGTLATVPYGMFVGLLAAAWFGGLFLVQHLVLRILLQRQHAIPPIGEFADMLNLASDRYMLSRVGGGFRFFHGYLQDFFIETFDETLGV